MLVSIAKAVVCLALGQAADDVIYSNSRAQRLEASVPENRRAEVRELLLFASRDQGETWGQVSRATPEQREFTFAVPVDGSFWLRAAVINKNGKQEPENLYRVPPHWKLVIDTMKPLVRLGTPTRFANEISLSWEIREDLPEWSGFKLEYVTTPTGTPIPVATAPGLTGTARFTPNTNGPVTVRLTMRDKAGNETSATVDVAGREEVAAAPTLPPQQPTQAVTPPPADFNTALAQASTLAPVNTEAASVPPMTAPPVMPPSGASIPGNPAGGTFPASERPKAFPPPVPLAPVTSGRWAPPPAAPQAATSPMPPPLEQPIASSQQAIQQVQYQSPSVPIGNAPRRALPTLQYVNSPEVVLEYELSKVGPSGVGSVDIFVTDDDGQAWQHVATDPMVVGETTGGRHKGIVVLPGDGVYGFNLLVKSQAQLKQDMIAGDKKAKGPRSGDVPEVRVEVDTTPPVAELFPPRRDPAKANCLMLVWTAADKNLGTNPITLEWAERREGPWFPIASAIANSGKHSWQLPDRLPVQVYMRLRVRDLAGNEGVATTSDPQLVDLSEPEGRLLNVTVPPRKEVR